MDILLPRPRERNNPRRSQSVSVRMNSAAGDFADRTKETSRNEHPECGSELNPSPAEKVSTRQAPNETCPQSRLPDDWSHLEPDERGAELAREARFWKVYVEETDKWDKERVEGWDKSMDVLLVFAALFSAISGAFLIETSKLLKEDPTDVSAAALRVIAQVLVTTSSNNSTMDPPTLPPPEEDFVPSKIAVIINTLWYMSLSLSIATAFLAMLAKDWCYSFLAHRTGHPRDQAHRRQRKWKLIERWKMEELIIVLPSLMHLSLLLFAVGLCIYLWDLNSTIAIPVMCIAGAFLAFYIWSSVAASFVEDFPYTTIVSRIIRSKYMRVFKEVIVAIGYIIFVFGVLVGAGIYIVFFCVLLFIFVVLNLLPGLVYVFACFLAGCRDKSVDRITEVYFRFLDITFDFTMTVGFTPVLLGSGIYSRIRDVAKKLELPEDLLTSLALGWLIEHCETPSAVDIALQAIAGASQRIPRGPLRASGSTEQIMRRIVAHDARDKGNSSSSLYIRGLDILRLDPSSNPDDKKHGITGDLEVMVWDLKSKNEREIAELIKDGSFVPSDHNLEAMRIGNSAASQSLGLLRGEATSTRQTLCLITKLLFRHFEFEDELLHPAALQSLANAASLHLALSESPELPPGLVDLFMRHCEHFVSEDDRSPRNIPAVALFIMCVLLHGNPGRTEEVPPDAAQSVTQLHTHAWHAIRTLIDINVEGAGFRNRIFWIGCSEILSNPSKYGLNEEADAWTPLRNSCSARASKYVLKRGFPFVSSWDPDKHTVNSARNKLLRGVSQVYELIEVSRSRDSGPTHLPGPLHTILTMIACSNSPDKRQIQTCNELLAKFGFPRPNEAFIASLELPTNESNKTTLAAIGATYTNNEQLPERRYFAATQLWLLLHLTDGLPSDDLERLKTNMTHELEDSIQLESKGFDLVKQELEAYIIEGYRNAHRTSNREVDNEKDSPSIWEKIKTPSLKWFTGGDSQRSSLGNGNGLSRVKNALGMGVNSYYTLGRHQRLYTARITQLILQTREPQDNEDLLSLIEDDFKDLPPYLRDLTLSSAPLFPPRIIARSASQTEVTLAAHTTAEAQITNVGHVGVVIYDHPDKSNSGDHDSDLGIEARFNESSEALLSRIV